MPEGHTLHRLARELTGTFTGRVVASSSPQGRFAAGAARVDAHTFRAAEAWGKHLLVRFDDVAEQVHVHLGLFGRWSVAPATEASPPDVVGLVRWRLLSAGSVADLRGPTACELLTPGAVDVLLARLGPVPLRPDADPEAAWQRVSRSRAPIATLLMDQSVVAGIGNVYRAEVLFRLRLDPGRPGTSIDRTTWDAVWRDQTVVMASGVRTGRIDTVRPEHEPEAMGRSPRDDDHGGEVYVYRRAGQPCLVCGATVLTRGHAGRNLFWCPRCQAEVSL